MAASVGTFVGGLIGCELGIAAGKIAETSDRIALEAGIARQSESPLKQLLLLVQ